MSKPLTDQQRRFCEFYVAGEQAGRAYERAGYKARGRVADANASRLLTKANVAEYVRGLREEAKKASKITRDEVVQILSDVVKSKPEDANMENPLCELAMSKAGPFAKFPDKARALERLAKMLGWDEPEKHKLEIEVVIGGNSES